MPVQAGNHWPTSSLVYFAQLNIEHKSSSWSGTLPLLCILCIYLGNLWNFSTHKAKEIAYKSTTLDDVDTLLLLGFVSGWSFYCLEFGYKIHWNIEQRSSSSSNSSINPNRCIGGLCVAISSSFTEPQSSSSTNTSLPPSTGVPKTSSRELTRLLFLHTPHYCGYCIRILSNDIATLCALLVWPHQPQTTLPRISWNFS